jgi:hypothetical protein
MRIHKPLLKENKQYILENVKQAKQYVQAGKLSEQDLKTLIEIDPTPTRKFVGWMAKIWITEHPDLDDLGNTVEEYNTFLEKGKAKTKDIYQFKSFKDLQSEVDTINQSGEGVSNKDLESDYDVVIDNTDLLIVSPHTHEASRKLGLSHFAFRDCEGGKDSAWCTTYRAPDHFNKYYHSNNVTFYYIKVKSPKLIEQLMQAFPKRWKNMVVVAFAVYNDGKIEGYDGVDSQIKPKDIRTFTNIIGIS